LRDVYSFRTRTSSQSVLEVALKEYIQHGISTTDRDFDNFSQYLPIKLIKE
jgi:hypothetical protein